MAAVYQAGGQGETPEGIGGYSPDGTERDPELTKAGSHHCP
jgi:hypothetical protein